MESILTNTCVILLGWDATKIQLIPANYKVNLEVRGETYCNHPDYLLGILGLFSGWITAMFDLYCKTTSPQHTLD